MIVTRGSRFSLMEQQTKIEKKAEKGDVPPELQTERVKGELSYDYSPVL